MEYANGKMLADVEAGIGMITFNQPEKRNAISVEMWIGLAAILERFAADPAVKVVVLTGAGRKAFVSGADISQFDQLRGDADAQQDYDRMTSAGRAALAGFAKPMIAEIRGFCLGGGLNIAMQADIRIAAEAAQFGAPAAKIGNVYGLEMARKLVSLIGPAHARLLLYTGDRIDAAEAERIGLVNRVVAEDVLTATVRGIARAIAGTAPLSVFAHKVVINEAVRDAGERDVQALQTALKACLDSEDYREGRTAFMEKRLPQFIGR
jgi:enoyl-CoA hydratase/carnithine racemase